MLRANEEQLCSFPEVVMKAQQNKLGGYPACACTQTHTYLSDLPGKEKKKTDQGTSGMEKRREIST